MLEGRLFLYGTGLHNVKLAAFESGSRSTSCVVFLGGLTDGLISIDYCVPLAQALQTIGFSFIQPVLSSSYLSYGMSSLAQDSKELDSLLAYLIENGYRRIFLLGHSTGCQDIIYWTRHCSTGTIPTQVKGIILQAPTSDRLYREVLVGKQALTQQLQQAAALLNHGTCLPLSYENGLPIAPERFLSLCVVNGEDDLFSADLSDSIWKANFRHASIPAVVFYSALDETVSFDEELTMSLIREKFIVACPNLDEFVVVEGANHSLSNSNEAVAFFIKRTLQFLTAHQ